MAIFSRRTLQRLLDENVELLTCAQHQTHVDRLNGKDPDQRVATEWEVAILNAASKLVRVTFEPQVHGTRMPDLLLAMDDEEALVEITTVSDKGLHEANPVEYLCSEFCRRLRKLRLDPNKFSIEVGGNHTELWLGGEVKATLKLPQVNKFQVDIFGDHFSSFVRSVRSKPLESATMEISSDEIQLKCGYNPRQEFFTSSHLAYTVSHLAHSNPLFNRLKRKAEQLREADYQGTTGIIVCDGGCALLTDPGRRGMSYGARDVVQEFFRCYPRVGFVEIVSVKSDFHMVTRTNSLHLVSSLYANTNTTPALLNQLTRIQERLPDPERTPSNAYHQYLRSSGGSFAGGWRFDGKMRISVRTLQELLAGRMTSSEFLEAHGNFKAGTGPNIFDRMLSKGQLISSVNVIRGEPRDDDWIEFEFGEPDPAIAPFWSLREKR